MTSSKLTRRLVLALTALLAASAALALGVDPDLLEVGRMPDVAAWTAAWLDGDDSDLWKILAAVGVMGVICKRSGKA